jgi:hypothetical protein
VSPRPSLDDVLRLAVRAGHTLGPAELSDCLEAFGLVDQILFWMWINMAESSTPHNALAPRSRDSAAWRIVAAIPLAPGRSMGGAVVSAGD